MSYGLPADNGDYITFNFIQLQAEIENNNGRVLIVTNKREIDCANVLKQKLKENFIDSQVLMELPADAETDDTIFFFVTQEHASRVSQNPRRWFPVALISVMLENQMKKFTWNLRHVTKVIDECPGVLLLGVDQRISNVLMSCNCRPFLRDDVQMQELAIIGQDFQMPTLRDLQIFIRSRRRNMSVRTTDWIQNLEILMADYSSNPMLQLDFTTSGTKNTDLLGLSFFVGRHGEKLKDILSERGCTKFAEDPCHEATITIAHDRYDYDEAIQIRRVAKTVVSESWISEFTTSNTYPSLEDHRSFVRIPIEGNNKGDLRYYKVAVSLSTPKGSENIKRILKELGAEVVEDTSQGEHFVDLEIVPPIISVAPLPHQRNSMCLHDLKTGKNNKHICPEYHKPVEAPNHLRKLLKGKCFIVRVDDMNDKLVIMSLLHASNSTIVSNEKAKVERRCEKPCEKDHEENIAADGIIWDKSPKGYAFIKSKITTAPSTKVYDSKKILEFNKFDGRPLEFFELDVMEELKKVKKSYEDLMKTRKRKTNVTEQNVGEEDTGGSASKRNVPTLKSTSEISEFASKRKKIKENYTLLSKQPSTAADHEGNIMENVSSTQPDDQDVMDLALPRDPKSLNDQEHENNLVDNKEADLNLENFNNSLVNQREEKGKIHQKLWIEISINYQLSILFGAAGFHPVTNAGLFMQLNQYASTSAESVKTSSAMYCIISHADAASSTEPIAIGLVPVDEVKNSSMFEHLNKIKDGLLMFLNSVGFTTVKIRATDTSTSKVYVRYMNEMFLIATITSGLQHSSIHIYRSLADILSKMNGLPFQFNATQVVVSCQLKSTTNLCLCEKGPNGNDEEVLKIRKYHHFGSSNVTFVHSYRDAVQLGSPIITVYNEDKKSATLVVSPHNECQRIFKDVAFSDILTSTVIGLKKYNEFISKKFHMNAPLVLCPVHLHDVALNERHELEKDDDDGHPQRLKCMKCDRNPTCMVRKVDIIDKRRHNV